MKAALTLYCLTGLTLAATVILSHNPELRAGSMILLVIGMPCAFGLLCQLDLTRGR